MANLDIKRIGAWEILDQCIVTDKGERKWLCHCDCGTERYVLERSLRYGGSQGCGCLTRQKARDAMAYKLEGQVFGDLAVLHEAEKQRKGNGVRWTCQCTCGNRVDVLATLLVTGRRTHCGCKTQKTGVGIDITGRRFGRLVALCPTQKRSKRGSVIWHCRCDCGNEVDAAYNELKYTNLQSCGCQKKEHDAVLSTFLTHVSGTSLDMIRSKKIPANNTSGTKGVYFIKGKWVAKIVFQKKQYYLGKFDTADDAARVRKEAEEKLFDGFAAFYAQWKEKADMDPEWAANNPIEIRVSKRAPDEISVIFLPVLS